MINRRSLLLAFAALLGMALQRPASAQDAPPKIATVNLAKVFNELQETKDFQQKLESDRKAIQAEAQKRGAEIEQLKKDRQLLKEGSDDFNKKQKELIEKTIAAQTWQQLIQADLFRQQKNQIKGLLDKIEETTKTIAEGKKIDLVVVEQKVELPAEMDNVNADQLRAMIQMVNQRTVLYNNGKLDITGEVIAALDAAYKKR